MLRNQSFAASAFLALPLALLGCLSESTSSEDFGDLNARHAKAQDSWKVLEGSELRGFLVRFEESTAEGSVLLSVRNRHNQDLGWIDQLGRAWRYRPHEDPEWVSTGSTVQGVRGILGLGEGVHLQGCALDELPPGQ
ncbi:MAG: hypothetical protein GY930_08600 [bacterium]|nr:hypothetical protein [bacterium]